MSKVRVYELAKEAGLKSKELADKLIAMGYPIASHSSSVDDCMAADIRSNANGEAVPGPGTGRLDPPGRVSSPLNAVQDPSPASAVASPDARFALAAFKIPASRAIAADVVRISAETPSTVFARESSSSATASSASRILISSASGLPVIGSAAEVGSGVENRNHGAQTEPALTPIPAMRLSTLAVIRLRPVRMREALRANRPQRRRRHRQHARSPNPRMLHRES